MGDFDFVDMHSSGRTVRERTEETPSTPEKGRTRPTPRATARGSRPIHKEVSTAPGKNPDARSIFFPRLPCPAGRTIVAMHPYLSDPWIAEQIDAAIAPYRGKWTERQIEAFREKMAWTLASHPTARRLLAREHRPNIDQSGELLRDGIAGGEEGAARGGAGRGSKAG
jgi:hypothetical protein